MATLVNRHVWHTAGGVLQTGTIIQERRDTEHCELLLDNPPRPHETVWISSHAVTLTLDAAIRECEENARYWQVQVERLEKERGL